MSSEIDVILNSGEYLFRRNEFFVNVSKSDVEEKYSHKNKKKDEKLSANTKGPYSRKTGIRRDSRVVSTYLRRNNKNDRYRNTKQRLQSVRTTSCGMKENFM